MKLPVTSTLTSDHCNRIPILVHVNLVRFPLQTIFVARYAFLVQDTANEKKRKEIHINIGFGRIYLVIYGHQSATLNTKECNYFSAKKIVINDLHHRIRKKGRCLSLKLIVYQLDRLWKAQSTRIGYSCIASTLKLESSGLCVI